VLPSESAAVRLYQPAVALGNPKPVQTNDPDPSVPGGHVGVPKLDQDHEIVVSGTVAANPVPEKVTFVPTGPELGEATTAGPGPSRTGAGGASNRWDGEATLTAEP
jgi:hypothetical protein